MTATRAEFADLLRERMDGRRQADLAADLGIDQASVSRYLRGTHKPSARTARRIAERWPELRDPLTALLLWDAVEEGPSYERLLPPGHADHEEATS